MLCDRVLVLVKNDVSDRSILWKIENEISKWRREKYGVSFDVRNDRWIVLDIKFYMIKCNENYEKISI